MKAFLIAGTASGGGRNDRIASAALRARGLRVRRLRVRAYKCGPDFLDTGHLSAISGRLARNPDTWMLDHQANREIFARGAAQADVAIVEGMMGLFDGVSGGGERGSAAEIAKLLSLPGEVKINFRKWSELAPQKYLSKCSTNDRQSIGIQDPSGD